jgi:hypothetical protein
MAKANDKHTPKPNARGSRHARKSRTVLSPHSLGAKSLTVGAPAIGAPALGQAHDLVAEPVIAGLMHPGDTEAEGAARRFLYYRMLRNPTARGEGNDKTSLTLEMGDRFEIRGRRAVAIYEDCVAQTGAVAYKKRGPRGPTAGPRRRRSH